MRYDRIKVFSATKVSDRRALGEVITEWLAEYTGQVVDQVVRQSSDQSYHCLSIILFCKD